MPKTISIIVLSLLAGSANVPSRAQDDATAEMRSLDDQVQLIKSDVLSIAAELNLLEERLLYPSNTQLALFVDIADGEVFRLDAMQIQIDGQLVAHHIYSYKELEALQKGGVQRIYTGNIPTGDHQMEVSVIGKIPSGSDFSRTETFTFAKGIKPKLLGLTLTDPGSVNSAIHLGDW